MPFLLLVVAAAAAGVLPLLFGRCWKAAAWAFVVYVLIGPMIMAEYRSGPWIEPFGILILLWHVVSLIASMFSLETDTDDYMGAWKRKPLIWLMPVATLIFFCTFSAYNLQLPLEGGSALKIRVHLSMESQR